MILPEGGAGVERPKVTVVIPIYNVEKYLDRCIESVVKQTYDNIEIILVDDGSTDNCPAMCDDWARKDSRIKVIHKVNAGLGMARNTGIDNANGDYIFFFDSDDYVDCTIVEKCLSSALDNDPDVVIFGYCNSFENGREEKVKLNLPTKVFEGKRIQNELLPGMYTYSMGFGISAWGKMYRLSTIKSKGLRFMSEREIISEDAYFALEFYSKINKASIVDDSLYFYYKRNDSLSRIYKKDRQEQNDKFIQKSLDYIAQEGLPEVVKNHITARYHMYTAATVKQLMAADIPSDEKNKELNSIFKSETLHRTLSYPVLKLHKKTLFVFLLLLKLKCYKLCKLFLNLKTKK